MDTAVRSIRVAVSQRRERLRHDVSFRRYYTVHTNTYDYTVANVRLIILLLLLWARHLWERMVYIYMYRRTIAYMRTILSAKRPCARKTRLFVKPIEIQRVVYYYPAFPYLAVVKKSARTMVRIRVTRDRCPIRS